MENKKTYLLLQPLNISTNAFEVFTYLHVIRKDNQVHFGFDNMLAKNIHTIFKTASPKNIERLKMLSEWHIRHEFAELEKVYHKQRSGISFESYFERASMRHIYDLFAHVIELSKEMSIYHRYLSADGRSFKTALCKIHPTKAKLKFKASKKGSKVILNTFVCWEEQQFDITNFVQHKFLLERNNEYTILNFKDFQTLEWLSKLTKENDLSDENYFIANVLQSLEQSHDVDKSELLKLIEIEATPTLQIYLSEINNTFLMFTPQWNYENFIIENSEENNHVEFLKNEVLYKVVRNRETEKAILEQIVALHPNFIKQKNGFFYVSFDEAKKKNWFLKTYQHLLAENISVVGMDMLKHFRYSPHAIETAFEVYKSEGALLFIKSTVSFGEEKIDLSVIQKTIINNQRFVLLKDNSIGVLPDDWHDEYSLVFKHAKINKNELQIPQWILVSIKELQEHKTLNIAINKDWWQRWKEWQDESTTVVQVPETIQASLRPYQQKGFEWLVLLSEIGAGGCLADDMGLGKTLQTISFLAHNQQKNPAGKHLIVAPLTLVNNWKREIEKFAPSFTPVIFHSQNKDLESILAKENVIVITSYGTLRNEENPLKLIYWETVVVDESQNIKNPNAQITRSVTQLIAKNRIALSGTPIMNNTFDLYSQLNFALPNMFGSAEFFKKEYALPIDRDGNEDKIRALRKMTNPFVLRRTKKQVAQDLPDKTETILWCEMEHRQREVYETIKKQVKDSVFLNIKKDGLAKTKFSILQGILKLRQICCHPSLIKDLDEAESAPSIKIETLVEELRDKSTDGKSLVFSQFNGMLDKIGEGLDQQNIKYIRLDGSTSLKDREKLVIDFQAENSDIQVFLLGLKAGNSGLNLTAAEYVFLVDPWWNNAVEQQAIDRTHRIGQTKNIFSYKLICTDTIEEKITLLQQKKKSLSDELIVEEEGFVKQLSEEDINFLFE
jgi:SNF2 family DNA or RNA helicase